MDAKTAGVGLHTGGVIPPEIVPAAIAKAASANGLTAGELTPGNRVSAASLVIPPAERQTLEAFLADPQASADYPSGFRIYHRLQPFHNGAVAAFSMYRGDKGVYLHLALDFPTTEQLVYPRITLPAQFDIAPKYDFPYPDGFYELYIQ